MKLARLISLALISPCRVPKASLETIESYLKLMNIPIDNDDPTLAIEAIQRFVSTSIVELTPIGEELKRQAIPIFDLDLRYDFIITGDITRYIYDNYEQSYYQEGTLFVVPSYELKQLIRKYESSLSFRMLFDTALRAQTVYTKHTIGEGIFNEEVCLELLNCLIEEIVEARREIPMRKNWTKNAGELSGKTDIDAFKQELADIFLFAMATAVFAGMSHDELLATIKAKQLANFEKHGIII